MDNQGIAVAMLRVASSPTNRFDYFCISKDLSGLLYDLATRLQYYLLRTRHVDTSTFMLSRVCMLDSKISQETPTPGYTLTTLRGIQLVLVQTILLPTSHNR